MADSINSGRYAPEERARHRLDARFGLGKEQAHNILRSDAAAKRIYDCALAALVDAEREIDALRRMA